MRTAIYARKSTDREDKQVHSLEDQIKIMRGIARREGYNVVETIQESRSAKEPNKRPEFARMLRMAQDGEIECVLAWAPNRLSRNEVDGGWLSYMLHTGVLKEIRTPERTYRPEDSSLLFAIENAVATDYVRNLQKDVGRGLREKAERGWHACKAPIGYRNDRITREIVPDPERFDLVRRAWDAILGGTKSIADVHRDAVAAGLNVALLRSTAAPVSLARFHAMFREPFYMGRVVFDGKTYPGKHKPMVTEEEFATVQELLDDRTRRKEPKARGMVFAGCLRCARCGSAIVGERKVKRYKLRPRTTAYAYYRCSGKRGCPKTGVREEDLLRVVEALLTDIVLPRETAAWMKGALYESLERGAVDSAADVATLERERSRQSDRLRRLATMRLDGDFTSEEHSTLRTDILVALDVIDERVQRAKDSTDRVARTIRQRLDAAVRAGELSGERRDPYALAHALRALGSGVLNLSTLEIRTDPIIAKIAGFEPLRNGSERPKHGDRLLLNSVWWNLVEELRTLATEEVCCAYERESAHKQRYGRYSWRPDQSDRGSSAGEGSGPW